MEAPSKVTKAAPWPVLAGCAFGLVSLALLGFSCRKSPFTVPQPPDPGAIGSLVAPPAMSHSPLASSSPANSPLYRSPPEDPLAAYSLLHPDERHELPGALAEISGVTPITDSEVACVQDEEGSVFFYNLTQKSISRRIRFAEPGDYEDVTAVGTSLYVLRSDGVLFQISNYAREHSVTTVDLGLPSRDNEGLAYDALTDRLFIAPKSRLGKNKSARSTLKLFAYDFQARHLDGAATLHLDLTNVFDGRRRTADTKHSRKPAPPSRFLPASIAVQPATGALFVVSAVAGNLAVFDRSGQLLRQQTLDKRLFPQPEGITFLPNGDLVITNEGTNGPATLLRFRPKPTD